MSAINQVLISGVIAQEVKHYSQPDQGVKTIFTLANSRGQFFVQWLAATWQPAKGDQVLVIGAFYSVPINGADIGRIQAHQVLLLHRHA